MVSRVCYLILRYFRTVTFFNRIVCWYYHLITVNILLARTFASMLAFIFYHDTGHISAIIIDFFFFFR